MHNLADFFRKKKCVVVARLGDAIHCCCQHGRTLLRREGRPRGTRIVRRRNRIANVNDRSAGGFSHNLTRSSGIEYRQGLGR
ncbi:unannotated protein [freshwater metagenome]|uniref:Unannotated protein n=1 Tax=freshwater metagenome TaxID=449393 RepID=A0A6J6ELC5_9ZZZZ